jgi:hypothetical protein
MDPVDSLDSSRRLPRCDRRRGPEPPRGAERLLWVPVATSIGAGEGARGGRAGELEWTMFECMVMWLECMVVVVWTGAPPAGRTRVAAGKGGWSSASCDGGVGAWPEVRLPLC